MSKPLAESISIDTSAGVELRIDGAEFPVFFTEAEPVLHNLGANGGVVPAVRITIPAATIVTTSKYTAGGE
ncbi:hypothetical protein [Rhodococcus sp. MEB064]|uniref:hypothetical protein n=1 Tax=Rhodococcus sp. MEB064 TaxID=1587522 RepID=UPI0005ACBDD0|nr:hypothetical protein [Rhodococcus sp. MEB064]KIQ15334.1 hypothetical protein RU01_15490 [Rhodococcus sp. MEB064]